MIAAGSAACANASATPQGKVQNAFNKLSDQKSLTLGVSFGGSADQIYAALKGEDGFSKADAQLLADLSAKVSVSSDKPFGQATSGAKTTAKSGSFGLVVSDSAAARPDLFEVRSVSGKVYLRADIKGLEKLDTSSGSSSDLKDFNEFLDGADQLPASLNAVKAALKGEWISIDPAAFSSLAKTFGAPAGLPSAAPTVDAKSQAQVLSALRNAVAHNAKFKDLGNHDGADHVQLTVLARPFAKELTTGLAPVLKQIPGFKQSDLDKGLKDVPNRSVSADLAIKNGMISAVTVDLAQFDDTAASGHLPLTLTLDGGAPAVAAPAGAQELKPQDLMGLFMSGMPGLPGSSDTTIS